MKKYFILLIFLYMNISIVSAQTKDETALSSAVEQLRLAMVNADQSVLEKIVDDNLSYGHSSGNIEGKASFIESLTSKKSDFTDITLSDQTILITGDVALVRHKLAGHTNDIGKAPGTVNLGILLVWIKKGNDWKLLGRQAFKI